VGLALVRHVAEAHGGRVIVESTPGEGSRFTIRIPISKETT
jgi:signal transduction histidine kinase